MISYDTKRNWHLRFQFLVEQIGRRSSLAQEVLTNWYARAVRVKGKRYPDNRTRKIISDRHRFIAVTIPKAGSTSLIRALYRAPVVDLQTRILEGALEEIRNSRPILQSYFTFGFVRNPWDRVVSCYYDKIRNVNFNHRVHIIEQHRGLSPEMTFSDFVSWLVSAEGGDDKADRHWLSQHRFFTDQTGRVLCDFVGRMERFADDFNDVCARLELPEMKIPHSHRSKRTANYREYYTARDQNLVAQRYRRDIELFDYEF